MRFPGRLPILAALLLGIFATLGLTACGNNNEASDKNALTIYNGQHEELALDLTKAFTEETGIKVDLRSGDDADLANQIREEGSRTRADVLLTEEPGPAAMLAAAGLLAKIDRASLSRVDKRLVPVSGDWAPYAARSRVLIYNPKLISANELPKSILELSDKRWKGKFAYAPSGAFAATTSYLIDAIGPEKTLAWLKGIRANGVNEQKNGKVRDTVEAGQHAFGLTNHYYWWILAGEKGGPDKLTSRLHYFPEPDAGGLLLPSAAAIPKAATRPEEAQRFVAWLLSPDGGQKLLAKNSAAQYPVAKGVTSEVGLQPLSELVSPQTNSGQFDNTDQAKELMIEAGLT